MTEDNKNKINITLNIHDVTLNTSVLREEEELYRRAAKAATETINVYSNIYKGYKEKSEIITMALFDTALRNAKQEKRNDTAPLYDILSNITSEIEQTIKKEKEEK